MKILFGGDLSFAWSPRQNIIGKVLNAFAPIEKEDRGLFKEIDRSCGITGIKAITERAKIIAEAKRLAGGIKEASSDADFFCVNLECALSARGNPLDEKRFKLKASPHHFYSLKKLGVNAVCLANNHILDFGPEGLADTASLLDKINIPYCGLRNNNEAFETPLILERNNEKAALLNFVDPGIIDPDPDLFMKHDPCPFPLVSECVPENIAKVSREMPVVAVLHWGEEWSFLESGNMQSFARECIDRGASAVISHHTHLVGGIEEYRGRPIFYGLGNLFMSLPPFSSQRASRRILTRLEFVGNKLNGYDILQLVSDHDSFPKMAPAFKIESLNSEYLPESLTTEKGINFDSYHMIEDAEVTIFENDLEKQLSWYDNYLNLFEVIQGKLPIAPGWRTGSEDWLGAARSRELMGEEFLLTNIFHSDCNSRITVKFKCLSAIESLKLIIGYPDWFHPRREFEMGSLSLSIDEQKVCELDRTVISRAWRVQDITPTEPVKPGSELKLVFQGRADKHSYLAWRLLGY